MRTKGAVSNCWVKLETLNQKFTSDALIPVSRRFLVMNGIQGQPINSDKQTLVASGEQPDIQEVV